MRPLFIVAMAALVACNDDFVTQADGEPCYSGSRNELGVGPCRQGTWSSSAARCLREVLPATELCNGIDDDCNGQLDDFFAMIRLPEHGEECQDPNLSYGALSACQPGYLACVGGAWICKMANRGSSETCNGLDDDCNGAVDDIEPALCYTGNRNELLVPSGTCRAGVLQCNRFWNKADCVGEVTPVAEVCQNNMDDDCDGKVDEQETPGRPPLDVVFHIDRSGSMGEELDIVRDAIVQVATDLEDVYDIRWAAMALPSEPDPKDPSSFPQPFVLIDFGTAKDLALAVHKLELVGGEEPMYDSVAMAIKKLSWRNEASKIHILWTDEPGWAQSTIAEADAARLLRDAKHMAVTFCSPLDVSSYDALGRVFSLYEVDASTVGTILVEQVLIPYCR